MTRLYVALCRNCYGWGVTKEAAKLALKREMGKLPKKGVTVKLLPFGAHAAYITGMGYINCKSDLAPHGAEHLVQTVEVDGKVYGDAEAKRDAMEDELLRS